MNIELQMTEKPKTITQTITKYGKQLFGFIKGKTSTVEDAEDILQEVWYQLSRLTDLNEIENISAWLYSVSRNKVTDLYRKKKSEKLEDFTYENEDGTFEIKDFLLIDESENPELKMFKDLFWNELMNALDELPENQKQVFISNELEDKTLKQIAEEQNENIKTIISRKGYATKHLKNKLLPLYKELTNK